MLAANILTVCWCFWKLSAIMSKLEMLECNICCFAYQLVHFKINGHDECNRYRYWNFNSSIVHISSLLIIQCGKCSLVHMIYKDFVWMRIKNYDFITAPIMVSLFPSNWVLVRLSKVGTRGFWTCVSEKRESWPSHPTWGMVTKEQVGLLSLIYD